ncbi:unnamed protein product, partial [Ectocarpus sp. 13 AM-2016]
ITATQLCSENGLYKETSDIVSRHARERKHVPDHVPDAVCGDHFPCQRGPPGSARDGMADVYTARSAIIFVPACRLPVLK